MSTYYGLYILTILTYNPLYPFSPFLLSSPYLPKKPIYILIIVHLFSDSVTLTLVPSYVYSLVMQ